MLDFAIFAVTFVVFLIALLIYFYPTAPTKVTTVPGLAPSDPVKGNLDEIGDAGSLHQFLVKLHAEFGDIVSFYYTNQLCVSIACPELFKEHQAVFDRPPLLFQLLEPLITADSIQYANGADGRKRRDLTDRCFGFQALQKYISTFNKISKDTVEKLSDRPPNDHIALRSTCLDIAVKGITITALGDLFQDDKAVSHIHRDYDIVWGEFESRVGGIMPDPGSKREKEFAEAKERLQNAIREAIKQRRANPPELGKELFLDVLLGADYPESRLLADTITYFVGGFHTSGNLLAWAIFYIAQDEKVQEKLADHVTEIVGKTGDVTMDHIADMKYMRQVLDETLRVSVLAPYAARVQHIDIVLGGHVIPKGTPVVHALGVSLQSEKAFPNPSVFNPENFSAERVKNRHRNAFQPFGFAGRRVCPGQQFAYKEVAICLAWFVRAFKVRLVPGQETEQVYGLVTHVANKNGDDVWVLLESR